MESVAILERRTRRNLAAEGSSRRFRSTRLARLGAPTACVSEWRRGGNKSTDVHFLFFNPLHSRRQDVFRRTLGAGNGVVRRNPRNPHYDTEMQIKILVECWRAGEGLGQEFVKHSMREHFPTSWQSQERQSPPVPAEVLAHR